MKIGKYLRKKNATRLTVITGLVFYIWVLIFFIQTIDSANGELEYLDNLLYTAERTIFELAVNRESGSDRAVLESQLNRIGSNRALKNLTKTMSDDTLNQALETLTKVDSLQRTNRAVGYIALTIRKYKNAQYESITALFSLFVLLVMLSIIISLLAYMENRQKLLEKDIQTGLNLKLNEMLEAERNIIALELHDDLAQKLSVIKHHFYAPETGAEHSELLRRYIADSIQTVRQIAGRLKSPLFDRYTLQDQLLVLFSDFSGSTPIRLSYQMAGLTTLSIDGTDKLHIYRIMQELLSNARKHSRAEQATIKILYSHPVVSIWYADDGEGYDPATVTTGLGLNGIRFRLQLLGGTMTDSSAPLAGAAVKIEVRI